MNKIIGGEFAIDAMNAYQYLICKTDKSISTNCERKYPWNQDNTLNKYYSCGRSALFSILQSNSKVRGGVLLPDYLCESVTQTVIDSGLEYSFYHIKNDLLPDESLLNYITNASSNKFSAVLLINYFGLLDLTNVVESVRQVSADISIILDDVQNLFGFTTECDYDYAFTSFRKWLPLPDGAVVNIKNEELLGTLPEYNNDNLFAQYKLAGNLLKSYSSYIDDEIMLDLIGKGEEILVESYLCPMSDMSRKLLCSIDFEKVASARKKNAETLHLELDRYGIQHIYQPNAIPLFIPVFFDSDKRIVIRRTLFNNNIFCPIHWPFRGKEISGENNLYSTELSLICDQRYTENDMRRIVETIVNGCKDNG